MSRPRPLLSALLCLALVLNGIGGAMAGVRMGCASMAGDTDRGGHGAHAAAMAMADAHAGRHAYMDHAGMEHADMHHADMHHGDGHAMPMPAEPADAGGEHDCPHGDGCSDCSAACRSACIAQPAFAVLPVSISPVLAPQYVLPNPAESAHPAPSLRDPVRPPIDQAV
jgi:hypothetical protein